MGEAASFKQFLIASCCCWSGSMWQKLCVMCVCSCRVRMLFQMSLVVSVTHLNRGRPTRLFGGVHGLICFSLLGANVMRFTGCPSPILPFS